ncbi:biotin carboxylase N-terminal domain-containing protein [Nocardiopsis sp. MG754419]|uniref:acetyl/propionyl/methylcrotonyl-CoA carboxylase subunit alpha n=1 Tax=Nocardiopsis sp. MG754419 TaxID=2259865 RepID=UPI001BACF571|nr:biotin carboxylase N-terminal domain-containing protein [Nocardiopsis sp. MG754419]MBR8744074.1 acetyl/propionyl-CoA carboxylase subunit alpha [Nocardiopsis sp. MG754419]
MTTTPHTSTTRGVPRVLVANRGEIALRITRTLRRLGISPATVYTDADSEAPHTRAADVALRVEHYLDADAIVALALDCGATAVHPGYGFLSENAGFARACTDAGLAFIGPPASAIEAMGDKIRAKDTVAAAGVPVLGGFTEKPGQPLDDEALLRAAEETGYPLLIKPSAGGGGKGMRAVYAADTLLADAASARREALASFGDATLLVEQLVRRPRHIEVQVMADTHGNVLHLGERECSLQRRHQKVVEEAPSPLLTDDQRRVMGEAAVAAARSCGYVGAGTVEFIAETGPDGALSFSFLEMNTRLQVEHPVTEEVVAVRGERGVDLVELQVRVAHGEALPFAQEDVSWVGHAVESRVYAEDADRGFLPSGGPILFLDEPSGPHVRVDSGIARGGAVTSDFDPMLAKVITWGADRHEALNRMDAALAAYRLLGCVTNTAFLRRLLRHPRVVEGDLSTDLIATDPPAPEPDRLPMVSMAAALDHQLDLETGPRADRFAVPDGWRMGGPAWTPWRLRAPGHDAVVVRVRRAGAPGHYLVGLADREPIPVRARRSADGTRLTITDEATTTTYTRADDPETAHRWLGLDGAAWSLHEEPVAAALRADDAATDGTVRSPMPGTVLDVPVRVGQRVTAGTTLAVVEAMKMEHSVPSPIDGTVTTVAVRPGSPVPMDAVLVTVETENPADTPSTSTEEQR